MRHFSLRPTLTLKGRENKGLRGLSGKPLHPPLTDIPIAAYLFAAVFDVLSVALDGDVARQLFLAGTWVLLGGVAVSLLAAATGWADWHRSSEPGTQARRTVNTHATIMITVSLLVVADVLIRLADLDATSTPLVCAVLGVVAAGLVTLGASFGGALVFEYGFNVETAGDHPAWHKDERDVLPGQDAPADAYPSESARVTPAKRKARS